MLRLSMLLPAAAVTLLSSCTDPCVALAERICNCEPTFASRRACIQDRVTNQQGRVALSDADREICSAALDTCTCVALDENDLGACGFTPGADG